MCVWGGGTCVTMNGLLSLKGQQEGKGLRPPSEDCRMNGSHTHTHTHTHTQRRKRTRRRKIKRVVQPYRMPQRKMHPALLDCLESVSGADRIPDVG